MKFGLAEEIVHILIPIVFYAFLFTAYKTQLIEGNETAENSAATPNINLYGKNNDIVVKISEIDYNLQYDAEITLISGRRIAIQSGKQDKKGQLKISANFGEF